MRSILLTGSAGRIGSAFFQATAHHYTWRCVDRIPPAFPLGTASWHQIDMTDQEACSHLCQGIDTVVHLAADPSPEAAFYPSLLENNIQATYNLFTAAVEAKCRRFIFASSAQAVEGYPLDVQVHPDMPIRPKNLYGVSKCFGEALASYYAYQQGLSTIVLRIGNYSEDDPQSMSARDRSAYLIPRDLHHLQIKYIETPDIPFALLHAVSGNRFSRLDTTRTRSLVNYQPQDDGFADSPLYDEAEENAEKGNDR